MMARMSWQLRRLSCRLARASCAKALQLLDDLTSKTSLTPVTDDDLKYANHLGATWDTMAWILYQQGEFATAGEYAHAAWMLTPEPVTGGHLGAIYEALGKTKEAIHTYQLAIVVSHRGKCLQTTPWND